VAVDSEKKLNVIGIIPARWASTRLPGKVLADISGKPMIQHVWEHAKQSRLLDEVFIACDDEKVFDAAQDFGAKTIMTSPEHASGTDRIAAACKHSPAKIVLNIQGDEPLMQPEVIDSVIQALLDDSTAVVATPVKKITNEEDVANPNVVKVVMDKDGYALYFSRSTIPYNRDKKSFNDVAYYKHFGLYAYRKEFLMKFKELPASALEQTERLEQLRVLQAGYRIKIVQTEFDSIGVDTPEDLEHVVRILKGETSA